MHTVQTLTCDQDWRCLIESHSTNHWEVVAGILHTRTMEYQWSIHYPTTAGLVDTIVIDFSQVETIRRERSEPLHRVGVYRGIHKHRGAG